jgi:molybdate transport system regulatory protein
MRDASLIKGRLELGRGLHPRFFVLLEAIESTGSLRKAAGTAGLSYRGAWLLLDAAAAAQRLIETSAGGSGGTRLTAAARELLEAWRELERRHEGFLREQESWLLQQPALAGILRRFGMKITARNQLEGQIGAIHAGTATTHVTVTLAGGQTVTAAMGKSDAKRLRLRIGQPAIALVKASSVVLVSDFAGYAVSAPNQLGGTISRIEKGAVSSLVGLTLPGGATLTASVTNDAVEAVGLAIGQAATALFKAYDVLLAVAPD